MGTLKANVCSVMHDRQCNKHVHSLRVYFVMLIIQTPKSDFDIAVFTSILTVLHPSVAIQQCAVCVIMGRDMHECSACILVCYTSMPVISVISAEFTTCIIKCFLPGNT